MKNIDKSHMTDCPTSRRASVCSSVLSTRQIPRLVSVDEGRSLLAKTRRGSDSCRGQPLLTSTSPEGRSCHLLGAEFRVPLHRSSSVDARCPHLSSENLYFPSAISRPGSPCTLRPMSPMSPLLVPKSPTGSDSSVFSSGAISPLGTIQPDLYKKDDILVLSTDVPPGACKFGRLHFRLKYDIDRSDLIVHIIEAHDLSQSEHGGIHDPYVKLALSPEVDSRKRQTCVQKNAINPFFNETFKFPIALDELSEKTLILQLLDSDKFSHNDIIGEVKVPMVDVVPTSQVEIWSEIKKVKKPHTETQEILLTLSYLPSAERLTLIIVKARNLITPNNKDAPDAYIKVYLLNNNKRIKKKKTSTQRGTCYPVWNEAISFNVTTDALCHSGLELHVHNYDLLSSTVELGMCTLGPKENGNGRDHWNSMVQSMHQSVTMWHELK